MSKKKIVKTSAVLVAALLAAQSMGISALVDDVVRVRTSSQTQMTSLPESFFVNEVSNSRTQNFDDNWKFNFGDVKGAQSKAFDDSKWKSISVPHDYSIIQEYQQTLEAESGYLPGGTGWYRKYFNVSKDMLGKEVRIDFDGVYMNATIYVNGHRLGMHPYGYTPFSYDISDHLVEGENVIAVKVDHKTPSSRWYSGSGIYRSVHLTVMDKVHVDLFGQKIETPTLKEDLNGTGVKVNIKTNVVNEAQTNKNVSLAYTVYEKKNPTKVIASGTSAATNVNANGKHEFTANVTTTEKPQLWSIESPTLYVVKTEVKVDNAVVDTIEEDFGFRYFEMNKDSGAYLNGKAVKLKGVCMHHDQGSLGAAAYRDAIERQVDILQKMGCNSIRVTHNPAADVLIDICNEKGMLLIEEIFDGWHVAKNGNSHDYSEWFTKKIGANDAGLEKAIADMTWAEFDIKAAIQRGQNSPAIIMWSLGNEINEGAEGSGYEAHADNLIRWAQEVDQSREVTFGSNRLKGGEQMHVNVSNKITQAGGFVGTNYSDGNSYDQLHRRHPNYILYGSETASAVNSRGVYTTKRSGGNDVNNLDQNKQLTSYDKSKVPWGAFAADAWYDVIKRDFVAGEYVWTGFDYIGEPTPANGTDGGARGSWPSPKNSYFGIIDTAGFEKDSYYLYQSQWNDEVNTLHILPTWNSNTVMKDGQNRVEVVVYSDADKVELYLNNGRETKLVGTQEFDTHETAMKYTYKTKKGENDSADDLYATFNVAFKEGTLSAKAYKKNAKGEYEEVTATCDGRKVVKTSSAATQLDAEITNAKQLEANGDDLAYIEVDVKDKDGNIVPDAKNRVTFKVEGPGELVGVDNGSSPDHDSYKANNRQAHAGKVLAIVKATEQAGTIKVTASADGLTSKVVSIESVKAPSETGNVIDRYTISRNVYVKEGSTPQLPATVSVTYENGTTADKKVTWTQATPEQLNSKEPFQLKGQLESGEVVYVTVFMVSDVAGVLNYSTTVPVGTKAFKLPESRPAVFEDGTISNVMLNINWEPIAENAFDNVGTVKVNGTAVVLGKTEHVTATIRVQQATYTLGDNVATAGRSLTTDIEQGYTSDTLSAIINGSKNFDANDKTNNDNNTIWSNYKNSQPVDKGGKNDKDATLSMTFDTQQTIGRISVTFARDSWAMRYPKPEDIKFYGENKLINVTKYPEQATSTTVGTSTYVYEIEPTSLTDFSMTLVNDVTQSAQQNGYNPCTGIAEIEMFKTVGSFDTKTTSALQSLTINGQELSAAELERGFYNTLASAAELTNIATKDNAAVTVLPAFNKKVKLIIESEDHKTTKVFTINLERHPEIKPTDSSKDIKLENSWIKVDNAQTNEGKEKMIDNLPNTIWHTEWNKNMSGEPDKRYIEVTFPEKYTINGIRYLSRADQTNGCVTKHSILYKENKNDTEWKKASIVLGDGSLGEVGTWQAASGTWRCANIDPVNAEVIRFMGVETVADGGRNNHFMSCAEFRVVGSKTPVLTDISTLASTTTLSHQKMDDDGNIVLGDVNGEVKPTVVVKDANNKVLAEGVDYTLTYANNTAFGTASVTITGKGNYTGTITKTFVIKECAHTGSKTILYAELETCKKPGFSGMISCDDCGKIIDEGHVIPMIPHAWSEWKVVVDPTVDLEGKEERGCSQCGDTETRPIAKLVNKELLKADLKKAKEITANGYTETSYKALQDVIKICEGVLSNEKATQAEVNAAVNNLAAAVKGLVKVDSQDTNKPSENDPKPEQTPVKPVQPNKDETGTGDVTNMSMVASMLAASGFAVSSLFKRRNKK